jgi:hypothetical protein
LQIISSPLKKRSPLDISKLVRSDNANTFERYEFF